MKRIFFILLASILLLNCAPNFISVPINMYIPSKLKEFNGGYTFTVLDFERSQNSKFGEIGKEAASLFRQKFLEIPSLSTKLIERQDIEKIIQEHSFQLAIGNVDIGDASTLGEIIGADIIVLGSVTNYGVNTTKRSQKVMVTRKTEKYKTKKVKNIFTGKKEEITVPITEEVPVNRGITNKSASLNLNVKVLDVRSGQVLASESSTKSYSGEQYDKMEQKYSTGTGGVVTAGDLISDIFGIYKESRKNTAPLPSDNAIISDLLAKSTDEVCSRILPVKKIVNRKLLHCKKIKKIERGVSLANADMWQDAINRWEEAIPFYNNSPELHNDLGVAYEKVGFLGKARREYRTALGLAPDNKLIFVNNQQINDRIEKEGLKDKLPINDDQYDLAKRTSTTNPPPNLVKVNNKNYNKIDELKNKKINNSNVAYPAKIIKVVRSKFGIINMGSKKGILVNKKILIIRKDNSNHSEQIIGEAIIIKVKQNYSAIKIRNNANLRVGDYVKL